MKKLFILPLLASMMVIGCNDGGLPSDPSDPGSGGISLDIDKETAVKNLLALARTSHVKITYNDYSLTDPVSRYYASNGDNLFWGTDINKTEYVHEFFTNESDNTEYDRYSRDDGETVFKKQVISTAVEARELFQSARENAWSKLFFAHILDSNKQYKKAGTDLISGRNVQIYDRDAEDSAHERYWVDSELGITLKQFSYYDAAKTQVYERVFEVTSFVTGASVVPPNYK